MAKVYLNTIPREEALQRLLQQIEPPYRRETIPVSDALDRVTASPIMAQISLPMCPVSAMDGIAVVAKNTFTAHDQQPLILKNHQDYEVVDTGDPLPHPYDAVIKVEDLQIIDQDTVSIIVPVAPGNFVRPVGEDVVAGDMIIPAWHRLTPPDLGAILAGGMKEVDVLCRPKVAILPTGDEIVAPGQALTRGNIIEFNGTVLSNYIRDWGGDPILYPITKDQKEALRAVVSDAVEKADIVVINAGSSAGRDDYTSAIIEELGEVFVHGVATRPGKPCILGKIKGKPVLGIPGYPVSAYLALDWFGRPLVDLFNRQGQRFRPRLKVKLGRRIASSLGSEEFIRLTIGKIDGGYIANPLGRGAGMTMTMVRANGLLVVPANSLGYEQGEMVEAELYTTEEKLRYNLLATGSHDLALDFLSTTLKEYDLNLGISSAHVGSMGGIMAIRQKEAHLAGVHLLDTATGQYNKSFINQYFPKKDVVLVHLAWRKQGLMVAKGNPLDIQTVADIAAQKASYLNRQRGAGTRLLFDYLLEQAGLQPEDIYGYGREEYSHLNVAAAIEAGTADVGLGILSAAQAYALDFIPVSDEEYDLLMTKEFYQSEMGQTVVKAIQNPKFRQQIEDLGGYDLQASGKLIELE